MVVKNRGDDDEEENANNLGDMCDDEMAIYKVRFEDEVGTLQKVQGSYMAKGFYDEFEAVYVHFN